MQFVYKLHNMDIKEETEFKSEPWNYKPNKSMLVSGFTPEQVFEFVAKYIGQEGIPYVKYNRQNLNYKAICIILMRSICGFSLNDICSILGNVTASNVWQLCEIGLNIITKNYKNIVLDFINYTRAVTPST
ncbi:hypothetical protein GOM49_13130 [Clostridium bovifaecis]|uniref:Uncharacterized protein n=1 Tax=Clostridium bovifaecis TaxID=2184719 RepID=A0A6I6F6D3_9CLOT|nr:hypothetical protein GOM49_13130 [Clostridium bovifaecis]